MCAQRRQSVAAPMGRSSVCRGAAGCREAFRSPRAWAFTLLGLDAYCAVVPDDVPRQIGCGTVLADRLMAILAAVETPELGLVRGRACL